MPDDTRRLVVVHGAGGLPDNVRARYDAALPLGELRERIAEVIPQSDLWSEVEIADAVLRVLLAESGDA